MKEIQQYKAMIARNKAAAETMTQPTDAQVEAAAKAMHEAHQLTRRLTTLGQCRALARIALGAAMQQPAPEPEHTEPVGMVTPAGDL
jgi:hypothetical protein